MDKGIMYGFVGFPPQLELRIKSNERSIPYGQAVTFRHFRAEAQGNLLHPEDMKEMTKVFCLGSLAKPYHSLDSPKPCCIAMAMNEIFCKVINRYF